MDGLIDLLAGVAASKPASQAYQKGRQADMQTKEVGILIVIVAYLQLVWLGEGDVCTCYAILSATD